MALIRLLVFTVFFAGSTAAYPMPSKPQGPGVYNLLNMRNTYVDEVSRLKASSCGNYFATVERGGEESVVFLLINGVRKEGPVNEYLVTVIITDMNQIKRIVSEKTPVPSVSVKRVADRYLFSVTMNLQEYFGSPCFFTGTVNATTSQKTP